MTTSAPAADKARDATVPMPPHPPSTTIRVMANLLSERIKRGRAWPVAQWRFATIGEDL